MSTLADVVESERGHVRITALKAMQLKEFAGETLIKVETDAGLVGYGEAGSSGPMARAYLKHMEPILLGRDPLEIDKLYNEMTALTHPYRAHIPTISGVDIALWDLAGKILDRPISRLLNGRYRDAIALYINTPGPEDWFSPVSCQEWAAELKAHPYRWKAYKFGFERMRGNGLAAQRYKTGLPGQMLTTQELRVIGRGYENCRAALGDEANFIVHCHNEWDVATSIGLSEMVVDSRPLWIEDPLPVPFSDSWVALKRNARTRIKTGEKLELPREFLPFFTHQAIDVIHPDIVFAGGLTGMKRIAELADLFYIPVVTHNVGGLVHCIATAHFGAATRNFVMSESRLGRDDRLLHMSEEPIVVEDGELKVPDGPGLGITLVDEALRAYLLEGEPFWE